MAEVRINMETGLAVVIDLPYLADEINDAHRQVIFHGKSMLLEARRAGEHLLKAKEQVRHGEFKAWIEKNCECSYPTASEYMRVAKVASSRNMDLHTFDGGIRAFLDATSTPREKPPEPLTPTFDRTDAEHVMKLHAMAERGGTESEREVAYRKLEAHAKSFGMGGGEAVTRAMEMLPDHGKTADQIELDRAEARIAELEARLSEVAKIRGALIAEFSTYSKEKLVDLCTRLTMQMEGYTEPKKAA